MKYGFGVDVGGTAVKLGLFEETGALVEKWDIPTRVDETGSQILPDIAAQIAACITRHGLSKADIAGVGIGVPGPVNDQGLVNRCVNLNWGVFNIHEALGALTGLPVKAGNDANVAALGEYYSGGGKGCHSMVLVTLGTGVGGGIIIDGKILSGAHGVGGEIGHIVVNKEEKEFCTCGKRGCAEQYCSATGIVRTAKKMLAKGPNVTPLRDMETFTCKDVFDCAAQGDFISNQVLDTTYTYMGEFIADVCCVVDPERVVLGGGVSAAGQVLIDGLLPYFKKFMFHACKDTAFSLAELGNDAGIYGAFGLVKGYLI